MRQIMRRVWIALGMVAAVALTIFLTDRFEALADRLMARLGAVRTLWLLAGTTLVLGALWIRYGGARVARGWGIVLKPARPTGGAAGAGSESTPPLVRPRK